MIQQIHDVPENIVAFRSSGEVTKDDFDGVFAAAKDLVDRTGKLNYLLQLDNSPSDFTVGAWLRDALLGVKNLSNWHRAAIVSDSEVVIKFTDLFSKVIPGEFKGFHKNELQEAINWTSGTN